MASLVDIIGGNAAQRQDPFTADIAKDYSEGQRNAIALGGQFLQAKQLEAQIKYQNSQINNQWQERLDNSWKRVTDLSVAGSTPKQLDPAVNAIDYINQKLGKGAMSDDQKNDIKSTFSMDPEFGSRVGQLQSMMAESISNGQPLDPKFSKMYQEIQETPGIAASSRRKDLESALTSYQAARGREMTGNVGSQAKSFQDTVEDTNKTIKDVADKNVNADPSIGRAIDDSMNQLSVAIKNKDQQGVLAVQKRVIGLQNQMGNPSWKAEQGNKYNEEISKRQDTLNKSLSPYDKINENLSDSMNRLQNALDSGASATETRQQVGTLVSAIENAKGQTNKYKMALAFPTTYGTDIKNWFQTKVMGGTADFDPGEKQKYQQLYNDVRRAHVQAMDNVADQQTNYGKNAKDKWSKDAWGPNGGNTQTIKDWKNNVHQMFGVAPPQSRQTSQKKTPTAQDVKMAKSAAGSLWKEALEDQGYDSSGLQ